MKLISLPLRNMVAFTHYQERRQLNPFAGFIKLNAQQIIQVISQISESRKKKENRNSSQRGKQFESQSRNRNRVSKNTDQYFEWKGWWHHVKFLTPDEYV